MLDQRCDFVYYNVGGEAALNPHYNQNYTREEIDAILAKIKSCVEKGRYVISQNENRQENIDFINEYNIRSDKQRSILMQIKTEDFCHSLQNTKMALSTKSSMSLFLKCSCLIQTGKKKPWMFIRNSTSLTFRPAAVL